MQLLGSGIYVTSAFYRFVFMGVYLVHWTHSFLYLHHTAAFFFLQDGIFPKNPGKKLEKLRIDTAVAFVI